MRAENGRGYNSGKAGNNQLVLTWTPDTSPDVVDVYRNEVGCGSGFSKITEDIALENSTSPESLRMILSGINLGESKRIISD